MKINENVILNMVSSHIADNTLTFDVFDSLFYMLSRDEQYKVTDFLAAKGIELVDADDDLSGACDTESAMDGSLFGGNDPLAFDGVMNKGAALNNELLARAAQAGNEDAKSKICTSNWNLVRNIVRRYTGMYGISLTADDLEMAGMCGMLKAVERFNYDLGWKFTTYAEWWIRQAVTREIANHGYTIRIPVHKQDQIRKVCRAYHDMYRGGMPSVERVAKTAEVLGLSETDVMECLQLKDHVLGCTSLDMPIGEEGDSVLGDFIPADRKDNPEHLLDQICMRSDLMDALHTLMPKEEDIIIRRFGLNGMGSRTLEEVAKDYGVTRERIRQIEAKALRKLRHPSCSKKLKDWLEAA